LTRVSQSGVSDRADGHTGSSTPIDAAYLVEIEQIGDCLIAVVNVYLVRVNRRVVIHIASCGAGRYGSRALYGWNDYCARRAKEKYGSR
jgi:hypothetical protein